MEDEGDSMVPRYDLKLTGSKRSSIEAGHKQESAHKRVLRDLEFVLSSEDASIHISDVEEARDQFGFGERRSQVTNVPKTLDRDALQSERSTTTLPVEVIHAPEALDLNNSRSGGVPGSAENKMSVLENNSKEHGNKCVAARGIVLDLNVSSGNLLKSKAVSECGSSTSAMKVKDPLRVRKEMKPNVFLSSSIQNGFMSSSHTPITKERGRKPKRDVLRKKMELAKREEVDRFRKIATPSELLNGLNPGIINHVRNKKQVHSIIEALVRSEKLENGRICSKQPSLLKSGIKEVNTTSDLGTERFRLYHGNDSSIALCSRKQSVVGPLSSIEKDSCMLDKMFKGNSSSQYASSIDNSRFAVKLSSFVNDLAGPSNSPKEESANISTVFSLSVRTANVASQWLELLHQDMKGRLAALRRSKKRVKAVVSTELPFLISKEFSSSEGNNSSVRKISHEVVSNNPTAAVHQAKWFALFDRIDKALSEEERQLESSLNQVKELQLNCDHGLQHFSWNNGLKQQGGLETFPRSEKEDGSVSELAVSAAAASIYSTCSFLTSRGNVSC